MKAGMKDTTIPSPTMLQAAFLNTKYTLLLDMQVT